MSADDFVATAVATLLIKKKQILLGRRINDKDRSFCGWQCPGGYLHKGESVEQAAQRICLAKAGIEITALRAGPYSNNIFSERLHTTTLYVFADICRVVDNSKFENKTLQWSWFSSGNLPEPLFLPLKLLMRNNKTILSVPDEYK